MPSWNQERLEDWATVGPCWQWNRTGSIGLRCQPHAADASAGLPTDVFRLTEFVIVGNCVAHDAHNAFHRSLFIQFRDFGLLRNEYVTVESLRHSVSSIYQYLGQWVALRLKFKDPETANKIASLKAPWLVLCVDHEVADVLAEDLQLEFARTWTRFRQLGASHSCRTVVGSLGPASQAVVVAALCGLENFVSFVRSNVGAFPSHLVVLQDSWEKGVHGAGRHCVKGERQRFAIVV